MRRVQYVDHDPFVGVCGSLDLADDEDECERRRVYRVVRRNMEVGVVA